MVNFENRKTGVAFKFRDDSSTSRVYTQQNYLTTTMIFCCSNADAGDLEKFLDAGRGNCVLFCDHATDEDYDSSEGLKISSFDTRETTAFTVFEFYVEI